MDNNTNYNYHEQYIKYKRRYIKLKGGNAIDIDKIRGVLYGVSIGDALGCRYEFTENVEAIHALEQDMKGSHLEILGGGPFNLSKGQVSDDTEMTLCLLQSIATIGKYDQKNVALKYIEWFNSRPIDIGKTITKSLFTRKPSLSSDDMIRNSKELNYNSLSNGVLMRISPIAIYSLKLNIQDMTSVINQECALTHPNGIIYDSAFAYCTAIKYLLKGTTLEKLQSKLLKKCCVTPRVRITVTDSFKVPEPTYIIDEMGIEKYINTDDKKYQGYFGIALQNSFYELFNGKSFEESMINIIKRGGDTDTNCAIAGGILGAYYGFNKLNKNWIDTIKNAKYDRITKYPWLSVSTIDKNINQLLK